MKNARSYIIIIITNIKQENNECISFRTNC